MATVIVYVIYVLIALAAAVFLGSQIFKLVKDIKASKAEKTHNQAKDIVERMSPEQRQKILDSLDLGNKP